MTLRIYGSLALQNRAAIQLFDAANGYSVQLKAPASLNTDSTFSLPAALGQNDQVLTTDASGQFSFAHLADTNIAANAAIALSKLAAVTVGRVIVSDQSGAVAASGITATELDSLSGVTSNVQAQINAEKSKREEDDATTLASAKTYADDKVAALVNAAPALLDTLKELADALDDDPNFATTVAGSVATAEQNAKTYADNKDIPIKGRLDAVEGRATAVEGDVATLKGSDSTAGSVAKAAKDAENAAKSFATDIETALDGRLDTLEADPTTNTSVVAKIAAEATLRLNADTALSGRLDTVEGTGEGSIKKAVADLVASAPAVLDTLKELADALGSDPNFATTVTASISAAEQRAKDYADTKDTPIKGRLDTLEGADTVTGSVAKAEKDAKAYADALVSSHKATADWLGGTSVTLAHNWNTKDVLVQVYDSSNGQTILTDVSRDANSVTCTSVSAASMWRVIAFNLGPASGSSSGGGGGTPSSAYFMSASFGAAVGIVNWMALGATTENVCLEYDMAGFWLNVANLGPAFSGFGYTPSPLNLGGTYRLVFTEGSGTTVIGSPSMSFTYMGAGPGPGPGPVTYSFPVVIGQTDNGDGTITFDWSGATLPMMQEVRLVKVIGPAMYDIFNGVNLGVLTPTSSGVISSSDVSNYDSYALQTFMGPTSTATSASFQIPSGTGI